MTVTGQTWGMRKKGEYRMMSSFFSPGCQDDWTDYEMDVKVRLYEEGETG